ncbi:hypothetical protein FPQ18DRAFT_395909 [Pyronema domesticum]|nr:hypothetical protein FPQ18DRAFT_395909 [Pyronema domesticum]
MTEDSSNRPEDEGGQRGSGTGPEFSKYREKPQEIASDFSDLTNFEDEDEEDEEDAMEIETNKETNQSSAMIEKPNPEIIEANPPLPNPQPTNPETPENLPQALHTDVENPAKPTSPKKLKKSAAKEKPKRTEQRDSNRAKKTTALTTAIERTLKARRSERIIEKLTERSTRNQQRPASPMDTEATEAPEAGEDAQTMPESTTTKITAQENTAAPKAAQEKPNTATNRDQALLMIYNAIVESNKKVGILSQELRKVQAQNAVLTRELHQMHQWIGACVKTQGKRPPQNAEKAHATPETTKQPEKTKEKPAAMTKGIEDSIHAPKNQDTVMIYLNDKTNETQKTKGKQPDKAKANGVQPTKTTITSSTPTDRDYTKPILKYLEETELGTEYQKEK